MLACTTCNESGNDSLSVYINLVSYGVAKHVTGIQLSHFIENRGLNVRGCDLLMKYVHSRSFALNHVIMKKHKTQKFGRIE